MWTLSESPSGWKISMKKEAIFPCYSSSPLVAASVSRCSCYAPSLVKMAAPVWLPQACYLLTCVSGVSHIRGVLKRFERWRCTWSFESNSFWWRICPLDCLRTDKEYRGSSTRVLEKVSCTTIHWNMSIVPLHRYNSMTLNDMVLWTMPPSIGYEVN